ncbi:hypothetical protein QUB63_09400 [Microcoleus sp. ARI1-B5]|uniref:hypothetical protein n=1 Tax=unclassified Microcoleus TaxID=2642155 RepID=UPI002FD43C3D
MRVGCGEKTPIAKSSTPSRHLQYASNQQQILAKVLRTSGNLYGQPDKQVNRLRDFRIEDFRGDPTDKCGGRKDER